VISLEFKDMGFSVVREWMPFVGNESMITQISTSKIV
jgi:hypothetical protein